MDKSRIFSVILIVVGGAIAIYAQAEEHQSPYILIIGIVFLMTGIYRISRNIPSKFEKEETEEELKDDV